MSRIQGAPGFGGHCSRRGKEPTSVGFGGLGLALGCQDQKLMSGPVLRAQDLYLRLGV